jgi:hypothetical protein
MNESDIVATKNNKSAFFFIINLFGYYNYAAKILISKKRPKENTVKNFTGFHSPIFFSCKLLYFNSLPIC